MKLNSLMIAGFAAAGLALSAGAASAKTHVFIGVGPGFGGGCSPMDPFCGSGGYPGYAYRYNPRFGYDHAGRRDGGVWDPYRLTCKDAAWKLGEAGYSNVRQVSCGGNYHVLKATRHGQRFTFRANANTGAIVRIR